jgi:hypothetical protein
MSKTTTAGVKERLPQGHACTTLLRAGSVHFCTGSVVDAVLLDAGPLIAIIDRIDPHHEKCKATLRRLTEPLVTAWPVVTEAMYLLGFRGMPRMRFGISLRPNPSYLLLSTTQTPHECGL